MKISVDKFLRLLGHKLHVALLLCRLHLHIRSIDFSRRLISGLYKYVDIGYDKAFVQEAQAEKGLSQEKPLKSLFVCEIKDAYLLPEQGFVGTKNSDIVIESTPTRRYLVRYIRKFGLPTSPIKDQSTTLYATIKLPYLPNYFHWFVDELAKLWLLGNAQINEPITLLMPKDIPSYQVKSLDWYLSNNMAVEYVDEKSWIHAQRLLFPAHVRTRLRGTLPKEYISFLRETAFKHLPPLAPEMPARRLYISRSSAKRRRVLNELDVISFLQGVGFEVVQSEDLSLENQIQLFRNADWIVAPHGAGLTNMIFSDHATVAEFICDPPEPFYYFRNLAAATGHRHEYIATDSKQVDMDMKVDIKDLERKLIQLGI